MSSDTVYLPTDDKPIEHKILHVNDQKQGRDALKMGHRRWRGRLGVTRGYDPKAPGLHLGFVTVGHSRYAIYSLGIWAG
jgi:hypothetical protein